MDERQKQPIIGEAPAFLEMLEHVSRAAPLAKPVLVAGERGTGKELVASRLHFLSERWEQPLVKVNCAALTESILESELFGHEAGAFTGATRQHVGHFERADGGTLVLDELATVPLRTQEKILRVIEYGELERVGGSETLEVDVRIVGSTNEDLQARVADGRFRADLLDRLAFDVITVPPLRERLDDILPLAYTFAVNMTAELRRSYFAGFTARAASSVLRHDWPGNVRELKNAVERSVYRSEDAEAKIAEIAFDPFDSPFRLRAEQDEADAVPAPAGRERPRLPTDLKQRLAELETSLVRAALENARYNQRVAAGLLGLTYHQFRGALKRNGIPSRPDGAVRRQSRRRRPARPEPG
ncbi:MAG TPA: phage shock protein operon transcriptional activator [Woeseiaceae bacterium]|nr:phage shock protein operon transcriptional activator [Woeseiaceae bacterium]